MGAGETEDEAAPAKGLTVKVTSLRRLLSVLPPGLEAAPAATEFAAATAKNLPYAGCPGGGVGSWRLRR